jgi:CubicO group peptidase (beta-lactamase class C family)
MRIWHLMTHTSGLTYGFHHTHAVDEIYRARGFEWTTPPGLDLAACCDVWAQLPLAFEPGTEWLYSVGTDVLGRVVEVVSGRSLDAFLAERVFGPLGMRDTGFNPPASLRPRIAPTEVQAFRGGAVWGVVHDENAWSMGGVSGNAGLFSSARDLAVFTQMLLNGGEYGGVRILRPETIARWTARQRKDASRALGWDTPAPGSSAGRYFSARSFGHTGFTGTSVWADPEKQLVVVLLTNRVHPSRDNPRIGPFRRAVADAVQSAVLDAPLRAWERDSTVRR